MKTIFGKTIWATINRSKSRSASEESDAVYLVGLEGHCVLRTPSIQPDDKFGQVLFPIRPTKGSNRWKASGIGKSEGCHLPSGRQNLSLHIRQKMVQLGWDVLPHHIHPTLHLQITTYSGPYRIPLMERTSILWKPVKTWSSSLPRMIPSFGRMESWSYLKNDEK